MINHLIIIIISMGSYFTKGDEMSSYDYSCGSITLGQLITRAHGGDLILIQDQAYIDNYTMMNS
jgi:hypothetical protein